MNISLFPFLIFPQFRAHSHAIRESRAQLGVFRHAASQGPVSSIRLFSYIHTKFQPHQAFCLGRSSDSVFSFSCWKTSDIGAVRGLAIATAFILYFLCMCGFLFVFCLFACLFVFNSFCSRVFSFFVFNSFCSRVFSFFIFYSLFSCRFRISSLGVFTLPFPKLFLRENKIRGKQTRPTNSVGHSLPEVTLDLARCSEGTPAQKCQQHSGVERLPCGSGRPRFCSS